MGTMSDTPQILKAAQNMIERYGEDACRQVDERIDELSRLGADYGEACAIWCQVREAITTLQETPSQNAKQ